MTVYIVTIYSIYSVVLTIKQYSQLVLFTDISFINVTKMLFLDGVKPSPFFT